MVGQLDRTDRREAMRMFVVVALAVLVLMAVGAAGVYMVSDGVAAWADATFGAGIGLRAAAIVAFFIAFVSIVILTVVSGGDAILGELPFTLIGFFVFFLFCWLMIAWIF